MHLIDTKTFERRTFYETNLDFPKYAILSHRWAQYPQEEIIYSTYNPQILLNYNTTPVVPQGCHNLEDALRKVTGACRTARSGGSEWIWIDSCCINKADPSEITKSLSSMFRWYQDASICYTYLSDVQANVGSAAPFTSLTLSAEGTPLPSEWFDRGWTLQELIASENIDFYDRTWALIGTKYQLVDAIADASGIGKEYLEHHDSFKLASIATRMSWMAGRVTTEIEDIAWSLIGILQLGNIVPQYGEGIAAFIRLQEALISSSSFDESLFAWEKPADPSLKCYEVWKTMDRPNVPVQNIMTRQVRWDTHDSSWGLLAPSPDCFSRTRNIIVKNDGMQKRPEAIQATNQGVLFQLPMKEAKNTFGVDRKKITLPLWCWEKDRQGKENSVVLELSKESGRWRRKEIGRLQSLDKVKRYDNKVLRINQVMTVAMTIPQDSQPQVLFPHRGR